jgi:hypothetical protein
MYFGPTALHELSSISDCDVALPVTSCNISVNRYISLNLFVILQNITVCDVEIDSSVVYNSVNVNCIELFTEVFFILAECKVS